MWPLPNLAILASCAVLALAALPTDPQTDEDLATFVKWVQAGGAKMDKAVIKPSQWGYGVFATDTILPGEVFLEVPQALSLGEANVNRSAVGPVITDLYSNPQLDFEWTSTFSLVLLLVYEAHHCPESFWAPYFRMLPLSFSGHPNYATKEEKALGGLLSTTASMQQDPSRVELWGSRMSQVMAKHPELFGEDTPAQRQQWLAEVQWALTIADSRAWGPHLPGGDLNTMVPLLDMMNHKDGGSVCNITLKPKANLNASASASLQESTTATDSDGNGYSRISASSSPILTFFFSSTQLYQPLDELWIAYYSTGPGPSTLRSCNHKSFAAWGFTAPSSKLHDCATYFVGWRAPNEDAALTSLRTQAMWQLGLHVVNGKAQVEITFRAVDHNLINTRLLQATRIQYATQDELEAAAAGYVYFQLSASGERKVHKDLLRIVSAAQDLFQLQRGAVMARLAGRPQLTDVEVNIVNIANSQVSAVEGMAKLVTDSWMSMLTGY